MNRLERDVRPILTPLVKGDTTQLNASQIAALTKWLTLKVLVLEHANPDASLTPESDRSAFFQQREIPEYFRFYCAHNIGREQMFLMRHSHTIALSRDGPDPPLNGASRNVQVVTFVAGKAVFQVVSSRLNAFSLEDRAMVTGFHDRCCIWPDPPGTFHFPNRPRLNDQSIHFISNFLERFISASRTYWVD
ncbi:hypothetical protein [Erythrobacter sp.]|uniref:hypothetical protein n=1 Tax=Erythrobacter sp. TaxID=1042 RepID=UPI001425DD9A|nr:hypothetical protein [Erythrobacter sp.]QIQ87360.1 MAG: hypothetical protein G9473_12185 [Erythrobacter sp.]